VAVPPKPNLVSLVLKLNTPPVLTLMVLTDPTSYPGKAHPASNVPDTTLSVPVNP